MREEGKGEDDEEEDVDFLGVTLVRNSLQKRDAGHLAQMLAGVSTLTALDLSHNQLKDQGGAQLFSLMLQHIQGAGRPLALESFKLRNNQLGHESAIALASLLPAMHIRGRDGNSGDGGTEKSGISSVQEARVGLVELDLGWNALSGRAAVKVLESVLACTTLRKVNFSWNGLGDRKESNLRQGSAPRAPILLGKIARQVDELDMSHNRIGAHALLSFLESATTGRLLCLDLSSI